MYWFRIDNNAVFLVWVFVTVLYSFGGWLIATHAFKLTSKERILSGFGIGLVLYLWFCNLLGRWLDPTITFVISAIIVLGIGIALGLFSPRPFLSWGDLEIWPWILSGLALTWVFLRVSKGTGMFDEYKNLALISVIANGELPVRSYFGQPELLRYHYGYHIWPASMMRLGGMMPWSAFDLSKSIIWGYTILLAGLLGMRHIKGRWGAVLMSAVTTLAGGSRYLLLLLPTGVLIRLNEVIELMGISQSLGSFTNAMKSAWLPESAPPIDYPFAFLSGINPPYVLAHSGSGTLGIALFFLFILLAPSVKKASSYIFLTLFFSFWALTAEASFALICIGITLYFLWHQFRTPPNIKNWKQKTIFFLATIFIAAIISTIQGGTISALTEEFFTENQTVSNTIQTPDPSNQFNDFLGFSIRWPPAVLSAHLGSLPILSPYGIVVAVFEIGIIIIFLPWLTKQIILINPEDNWLDRILLITAWIGITLPIFVQWTSERDITRLSSFGMKIIIYLFLIYLVKKDNNIHPFVFQSGLVTLALITFSGIVLAGTQLTASPDTIYTGKYKDYDVLLLKQVWGRFPQNSKIFGPVGKGSILTGHLTSGIFKNPPGNEREIWNQLKTNPSFDTFIENGFEFVYFHAKTESIFENEISKVDCVTVFGYAEDGSGENYAGFFDLRECYNRTD